MKKKRSKFSKNTRKAFQKIHLWIGLAICVPVVLLGLTGSILVFQDALVDLFSPEYQVEAGKPNSVENIINAAQAVAPEGYRAAMYMAPTAADAPSTIRLSPASKQPFPTNIPVLVDPVSLEILSIDNPATFVMRQIFLLHSSLLIREYGGRNIIGWMGIAMLVMGISGLIIWWPKKGKWKKALTVKKNSHGLRLHRDLHSVVGIWGFAVFITVSFTGVYLAFPQIVGGAINNVFGARDMRMVTAAYRATPVEGFKPIKADKAIAIAEKSVPDSKVLSIMLPSKPEQPYRINLAYSGYTEGVPAVTVFIDPWSEAILGTQDPRNYSKAEKFVAWQHTVHEGEGFGWIWRILVFLAGFSPLLFSITGISMWLIKRKAK